MSYEPGNTPAGGDTPQNTSAGGGTGASDRSRIINALMSLLAEQPIERIAVSDVAARAGVTLAQMCGEFSSVMAILIAHNKEIDRVVLSGDASDMAEEGPRERLFDVLMRRLEALAPHKEAVRSLLRSMRSNPGLAVALNGVAVGSQQWMLTAAGIRVAGPLGMLRAQGLALLFGRILLTWVKDDDPGLARTMAALDRELARGQRWSGFLSDVCSVPSAICRGGRGWRSRRRRDANPDDEVIAA